MKYSQFYEWAARPDLPDRFAEIASKTLCRIPLADLAALQESKTKVDSRDRLYSDSMLKIGQAARENGSDICSVLLELEMGEKVITGVLAHELAHCRLGHTNNYILRSTTESEQNRFYQQRELEADALAAKWGFEQELLAACNYVNWRKKIIVDNIDKF